MTNANNETTDESKKHYDALIEEVENLIQFISFDERTPLTVIIGYADYLLSGQLGSLTEEQQQAIENMRASAKRLRHIVDFSTDELMLLNYLHGRAKPKLSRLDIKELIEYTTKKFATTIDAKNQQLVIDVSKPRFAKSDRYCCYKIIEYLIDNAHRYTGMGGQIVIANELRSNNIMITISDDGIGISAEERKHIFDRDFRGSHELVQQSGGLGRGLYNAKRLANVLGLEIGVESEVGKGSAFWVKLPLAEADEEE